MTRGTTCCARRQNTTASPGADLYHAFNGADGTTPSGDLLGPRPHHPSDKGNEEIAKLLTAEGFAPLA